MPIIVQRGTTAVNVLTFVAMLAWMGSLIARTVLPATLPAYSGVDAVVLLIVAWWFSSGAIRRNGGS